MPIPKPERFDFPDDCVMIEGKGWEFQFYYTTDGTNSGIGSSTTARMDIRPNWADSGAALLVPEVSTTATANASVITLTTATGLIDIVYKYLDVTFQATSLSRPYYEIELTNGTDKWVAYYGTLPIRPRIGT